jgi:hypothetical protein
MKLKTFIKLIFTFYIIISSNSSAAESPSTGITIVPLEFINNLPVIKAKVNGRDVQLLLDTGERSCLFLDSHLLYHANCSTTGRTKHLRNSNNHAFNLSEFIVPSINIEDRVFKNILAYDFRTWATNLATQESPLNDKLYATDGVIGLNFFHGYNLLIDYSNKRLVIIAPDYEPIGYDITSWHTAKFELNNSGIILPVTFDDIFLKALLDTGSTASVINKNSAATNQLLSDCKRVSHKQKCRYNFTINHHMIEKLPLDSYPLANMQADIILGSDFLEKYMVFINFKNKQLSFKEVS